MGHCFVPNSLTPGASSCTITILCAGLSAVRWCAEADYPDKLIAAPERTITVKRNGTYSVELTVKKRTIVTQFSVCHLKPNQNFSGGDGSQNSPYLIATCAQFNRIRSNLHAHYRLISNLNFKRDMKNLSWIPIGNYSQKEPKIDPNIPWEEQDLGYRIHYGFTGELDGDGHTISGLICTHAKAKTVGLFGSCGNGAYIHNITLKNCSFDGRYAEAVGGVVGRAANAIIERCLVINQSIKAHLCGGGVVGEAKPGTILRACQFTGTLISIDQSMAQLGGIAGDAFPYLQSSVMIEDCCVKAGLDHCGRGGGIVAGSALISRCFFSGSIRSSYYSAGITTYRMGLTPKGCVCTQAKICHSTGDLLAEQRRMFIGVYHESGEQLGQKLADDAWFNYCGRITCEDATLALQLQPSNYCSPSCILCTQSGQHAAIDGSLRDGTTIPEEDIQQSDFYRNLGWDFDTVWEIGKDGLPQIKRAHEAH